MCNTRLTLRYIYLCVPQKHCAESKKYQSIVTKFADFLVQYAQHNRAKAASIIFKHLEVLRYDFFSINDSV